MSTTTSPTPTASASSGSQAACQMPPLPQEYLDTMKVAQRLAELCSTGKNLDAIKELYAENARHVEVMEAPWCPRIIEGKAAVLAKAEQFARDTIIHGGTCGKPIVNGDQFLLPMGLDCTSKAGPAAGHRMNLNETALYTVKNGKITEGKFFYAMGC